MSFDVTITDCCRYVQVMPDSGEVTVLPQNSFLTCSNDSTLRLWTVESGHHVRCLRLLQLFTCLFTVFVMIGDVVSWQVELK